ncbi:MAG: hydroxypyruvate reductase [Thermodesulfobacteriota bacterium]|nr:MAG: hydroxypyruvate reductase [Thermodesulfobacteriota bacterium]
MDRDKARNHTLEIYKEAVEAANPKKCVQDYLSLEDEVLSVDTKTYNLKEFNAIYTIAFGKAAAAMAEGLEKVLGERLSGGMVISNSQPKKKFKKLVFHLCGHPVPDERSVSAASEAMSLLDTAGEKDLVIFLISGGGSALLSMPSSGLTLGDMRKATETLLRSGVDKNGLNAVRKHLSQIKGGGLLKKALPARVITLILSNVVSDKVDAIASGPTVPDSTTFEDAWRVVEALKIEHELPPQVVVHLEDGRNGELPETLKEGEFDPELVQTLIVGSNIKSLAAAKRRAKRLGYNTLMLSSQISGEAKEVAKVIAGIAFDIERSDVPVKKPSCIIFGGETTVTVHSMGKGGRSTETALSFCMEIINHNIVGLFCDTDGVDGPIDAAGAICDGQSRLNARKINVSAREHLAQNNSYDFFDKLGDLIITGPTGTNVMDIGIVIVE